MKELLGESEIFGNRSEDLLLSISIVILVALLKRPISRFIAKIFYRPFKQLSGEIDVSVFVGLLYKPIGVFILLITIFISTDNLQYPSTWNLAPPEDIGLIMIIQRSFAILFILSIIWILLRLVDYMTIVFLHRAALTEGTFDDQLVPFFKDGTKILIVTLMLFLILGIVFKLNIASLVAGLGIGGLAMALAAKETLENLLGSFTIFLDKPFKVGDSVIVNNYRGKVERIGLRSTRLRTLENSLVTVPNKRMVDAELDNLTERQSFRVHFNLTVTYSTRREKIISFIEGIKTLLSNDNEVEEKFSVRFHAFGDSALEIRIDYYAATPNFDDHLIVRERINLELMDLAEKLEISFAFPSRSIYMEKN